jgi:hypothetical protein
MFFILPEHVSSASEVAGSLRGSFRQALLKRALFDLPKD